MIIPTNGIISASPRGKLEAIHITSNTPRERARRWRREWNRWKSETGLHRDDSGIVEVIPLIIGLLLLLGGILLLLQGSYGNGLIVTGIGFIILGVGGQGTFIGLSIRVSGPVGLILIVLGILLGRIVG